MQVKLRGRKRSFRTVTFNVKSNVVELIDQRLLPHEFKFFYSKNYRQTASAIRDMVVRGAGAIGASVAAIGDLVSASGVQPSHAIFNSIFTGNRADIASPRGFANFRFGANLVEQTTLGGLGGNVLGTCLLGSMEPDQAAL